MTFSHEFKTPINGVLTILPLLKDKLIDTQDKLHLDAAITSARLLSNFLNNFIDYLSIEANEFEIKIKEFNLDTFLNDTLSQIMVQTNRKGLALVVQKDQKLSENIKTDRNRLEQVLINLLTNAVNYTSKGTISVRVEHDSSQPDSILFKVSDTGIGMTHEKKIQLFEMFNGDLQKNIQDQGAQKGIIIYKINK